MRGKTNFRWYRILGLSFGLAAAFAASYAQDTTAGSDQGSTLTSQFPSDENLELKIERLSERMEQRLMKLEKTKTPSTTASVGSDGFVLQSSEGDNKLQIGLLLQADAQFALSDSNHQVVNSFSIGRLRPYMRGRFSRRFEVYFTPDFAGGNLSIQDAYVDTIFSPAFRVRAGKSKTPFGLELLQSDSNLLFFNRGLPTSLVPNRDVGIQALGDISGGFVSYMACDRLIPVRRPK